jgi:hypothetical protein
MLKGWYILSAGRLDRGGKDLSRRAGRTRRERQLCSFLTRFLKLTPSQEAALCDRGVLCMFRKAKKTRSGWRKANNN